MSADPAPGRRPELELGAGPSAADLTRVVHLLRSYSAPRCCPPLLSPATMAALSVLIDRAAHHDARGRCPAHRPDELVEASQRLARAVLNDLTPPAPTGPELVPRD